MKKLRKYMLPVLLAIVLGLSGCGDTVGDDDFDDNPAVPGAVDEGDGIGE
jgi:hypothetical protein